MQGEGALRIQKRARSVRNSAGMGREVRRVPVRKPRKFPETDRGADTREFSGRGFERGLGREKDVVMGVGKLGLPQQKTAVPGGRG